MKHDLYPLPNQMDLDEAANEKLITFTFVRNPFDRFASAYYDKMTGRNWKVHHDVKRLHYVIKMLFALKNAKLAFLFQSQFGLGC